MNDFTLTTTAVALITIAVALITIATAPVAAETMTLTNTVNVGGRSCT